MIRSLSALAPRALAAALLAASLAPAVARADFGSDQGVYRIYLQNHLLGTERVTFEERTDSSIVISLIDQLLPRHSGPPDTLHKNAALIVSAHDGSLRSYQSQESVNGDILSRALSMSATTYTSYRQSAAGGFGDTYDRPPGRTYVVDPQVFALFDVICRDMHAQRFQERAITMLYITARDTAVDGQVTRLGKSPFKLGTRTVMAEKFRIKDPWSEFYAWVSPSGRMLRLTLPAMDLRVDRDPATLNGRSSPPPARTPIGLPRVILVPDPKPRARVDSLPPPPAR